MREPDDGGQAFPIPLAPGLGGSLHAGEPGMSLRDYFAAQALALLGGRSWDDTAAGRDLIETWATSAYAIADEMLKARQS